MIGQTLGGKSDRLGPPNSQSLMALVEQLEKSILESRALGNGILARMRGEQPQRAEADGPSSQDLHGRLCRVLALSRDVLTLVSEVDGVVGAP